MKTQPRNSTVSNRPKLNVVRIATLLALVALIGIPLFSSSLASSSGRAMKSGNSTAATAKDSVSARSQVFNPGIGQTVSFPLMMPQATPTPPAIATFETTCATADSEFNLGQDVCAKATSTGGVAARRRITWSDPDGNIRKSTPISSDPQSDNFPIPGTATSTLSNGEIVSNIGEWRVALVGRTLVTYATFVVKDLDNATADLSVTKNAPGNAQSVAAGSNGSFDISVVNSGPDDAATVSLIDHVPVNTTFVTMVQTSGLPTTDFTCTTVPDGLGNITCSIDTLTAGASATFDFIYTVNEGTPAGTSIDNTVSIASATTNEGNPADNSAAASATVASGGGGSACTLTCPGDMTVTADTTQAGQPGAFVTFSAASVLGNCGAVSNSPASGSFLTLGAHLITSTADSADICTFTVTVVDTPPPTISCPPNQTVTAAPSATSASVTVGLPSTNPSSGVTVIGIRSDDPNCTDTEVDPGCTAVPLTDPYLLGTTTITWTVIQTNGQRASCVQSITVNENTCGGDTTAPIITAPPDVTFGTGPDPAVSKFCTVALDDELGTATATDDCTFNISTTGIPANNAFPVGTTTVTYRATDGAGNVSLPATQLVTVFDNTPPIIVAPPNASYTCLSEVPTGAAAIALAHGDDPNLPNGGPPTDNCGAPIITYSDSSTGAGSAASPRIITRTYTATDASPLHNSSSSVQTITVIDPTPPVIVFNGQTPSMWPPNHKYTTFQVTNFVTSVTDNCDSIAVSSVVITKVTSDEIENGNGDGNTLKDIIIAANCKSVQLRSEREGNSDGRVYTIFFSVRDTAGNVGTGTAKVVVNHNPGETAVDSGPHYTVISNCP